MRRGRAGWIMAVLLGVWVSSAAALETERPPNVLLLLADDLGWHDVGWHGRTEWSTPHLDRLAARGLKLERFYTSAVVCAPSRGKC